jgi:superfamily II DNA/RNA helicase
VRRYQRNPVRHEVSEREAVSGASHEFRSVASAGRTALCAELVLAPGSSVVFVRTKHGADRVARGLKDAGAAAAAIHGDRTQAQRERTLAAFRAGRVHTLVATDVAARGIHVDDVARVIHYDLPADIKDYVHRSGRTARAGAEGKVIAFVTPEKRALAASLQRSLRLVGKSAGAISDISDLMDGHDAAPQRRAQDLPGSGTRRRGRGLPRPNRSHHGEGPTHSVRGANSQGHRGRTSAGRRRKPRG